MTDAPSPPATEDPEIVESPDAPTVKVVITYVEGADLEAALATVGRQVYEGATEVVVVSDQPVEGAAAVGSFEQALSEAGPGIDYLWILHSDARPRPDALAALVTELERSQAALGGSKLLVAGTRDQLESIGSATDVFGEPYSGLEEGEIDLQQYDVVREVAFVSSVSMLLRRDLAQGLRGIDERLEPVAAGLDLSQRVRLAGGKVIIVPSSEVYHQGRCGHRGFGWREQAGRIRAMLTAYQPITLAWMVPFMLVVAVVDSLANGLLLRWRPAARHTLAWLWNLWLLPSTIGQRRRFRRVRSVGDEELFRFQASGSIRLRQVGGELRDRLLFVFDDDQALARGTKRVWSSPGIWGAIFALLLALVACWSIFFSGVPDVGSAFPFEPGAVSLARYFGGWNRAGLGSPAAVHPINGLVGAVEVVWPASAEGLRSLLTVGFALLAVVGMGRLAGRLEYRGPGRYMAGLALIAGPGTAVATGRGSWVALAGAALLPWAVRSVFLHPTDRERSRLTHVGWALLWSLLLGFVSPLLVPVPALLATLWVVSGERWRVSPLLIPVTLLGLVPATPYLLGDPGWLLDPAQRLGLYPGGPWGVLIGATALVLGTLPGRSRRLGLLGGFISLSSILALALIPIGPGTEEAFLVTASFGAAVLVGAVLDTLSTEPRRLTAVVGALAMVALSVGGLIGGRAGLPAGEFNERLEFVATLAGEDGPGRVLVLSTQRHHIPGEARRGPGVWYRVFEGGRMTLDQVWLPPRRAGDAALEVTISDVMSGSQLRPGELLAPFAIEWVVLMGEPTALDDALQTQLDLIPSPLDPEARVYRNSLPTPMAAGEGDLVWAPDGTGFSGEAVGTARLRLALNHAEGWRPDTAPVEWWTTVSAATGRAGYRGEGMNTALAAAATGLLAAAGVMIAAGRRR